MSASAERRYTCAELVEMARVRFAFPEWIVEAEVELGERRLDLVALRAWGGAPGRLLVGIEVKASRADWLRELRDFTKAMPAVLECDQVWLLTAPGVVQPGELPAGWGHLMTRGATLAAKAYPAMRRARPEATLPRALAARLLARREQRLAVEAGKDRAEVRQELRAELTAEIRAQVTARMEADAGIGAGELQRLRDFRAAVDRTYARLRLPDGPAWLTDDDACRFAAYAAAAHAGDARVAQLAAQLVRRAEEGADAARRALAVYNAAPPALNAGPQTGADAGAQAALVPNGPEQPDRQQGGAGGTADDGS